MKNVVFVLATALLRGPQGQALALLLSLNATCDQQYGSTQLSERLDHHGIPHPTITLVSRSTNAATRMSGL